MWNEIILYSFDLFYMCSCEKRKKDSIKHPTSYRSIEHTIKIITILIFSTCFLFDSVRSFIYIVNGKPKRYNRYTTIG